MVDIIQNTNIPGGTYDEASGGAFANEGAARIFGTDRIVGPQGPEGPTGPAGPAGPAGPTGATGATGPQGQTGQTGATGPQGNYYVKLWQAAAAQPAAPTGTWTPPAAGSGNSRGTYTGTDGWSVDVPTPGDTESLWEVEGVFDPATDTSLTPSEFSGVFQAGARGPAGPTGPQGPQGAQGPAGTNGTNGTDGTNATFALATPVLGDNDTDVGVTNLGTNTAANIQFTLPRGAQGAQGPQGPQGPQGNAGTPGTNGTNGTDGTNATFTIGTVSDTDTAYVRNSGTNTAAVLDFGLQRGATGATGPTGPAGAAGTQVTANPTVTNADPVLSSVTIAGTSYRIVGGSTPAPDAANFQVSASETDTDQGYANTITVTYTVSVDSAYTLAAPTNISVTQNGSTPSQASAVASGNNVVLTLTTGAQGSVRTAFRANATINGVNHHMDFVETFVINAPTPATPIAFFEVTGTPPTTLDTDGSNHVNYVNGGSVTFQSAAGQTPYLWVPTNLASAITSTTFQHSVGNLSFPVDYQRTTPDTTSNGYTRIAFGPPFSNSTGTFVVQFHLS